MIWSIWRGIQVYPKEVVKEKQEANSEPEEDMDADLAAAIALSLQEVESSGAHLDSVGGEISDSQKR